MNTWRHRYIEETSQWYCWGTTQSAGCDEANVPFKSVEDGRRRDMQRGHKQRCSYGLFFIWSP